MTAAVLTMARKGAQAFPSQQSRISRTKAILARMTIHSLSVSLPRELTLPGAHVSFGGHTFGRMQKTGLLKKSLTISKVGEVGMGALKQLFRED